MKPGTNGVTEDHADLKRPQSKPQNQRGVYCRFNPYAGFFASCLSLLALASPMLARAGEGTKEPEGFAGRFGQYVSVSGSLTMVADNMNVPAGFVNGNLVIPQTSLALKNGYNAAGAFGIYEGNMRGEVEFSYRDNQISHVVNNPNVVATGGGVSAFSIMFNGFGDVPLTRRLSFYGGGGLGIAFMDLSSQVTQAVGPSYEIDSTSPAFALQAIVGLNFQLTRRLCLTGGYRLWTAFGVDTTFVSTGAGTIVHVNSNNHFDMPLIHGPEVGLRFSL